MSELDHILDSIKASEALSSKRRDWNPARLGEIDIRIAADGSWYHEGRKFQRQALVKLFASVLRREADTYYLVTPAEKLRIQVEDAPFVAGLVETIDDGGKQAIVLTTNLDQRIVVDADHPIRIDIDPDTRQPRPYVQMHAGLEALISRGAFYDLINLAEERRRDGRSCLCVSSRGQEFELGSIDE